MQISYIPCSCLVLLLSFQLLNAFPMQSSALTKVDIDVLKLLLDRLEESVPDQVEDDSTVKSDEYNFEEIGPAMEDDNSGPYTKSNPVDNREFLSARDLRTVKNDSSPRRPSACFGRRMDRIGSMSSLGCSTVGRFNPKKK